MDHFLMHLLTVTWAAVVAGAVYMTAAVYGAAGMLAQGVSPNDVFLSTAGMGGLIGLFWKVWHDNSASDALRTYLTSERDEAREERDEWRQLAEEHKREAAAHELRAAMCNAEHERTLCDLEDAKKLLGNLLGDGDE